MDTVTSALSVLIGLTTVPASFYCAFVAQPVCAEALLLSLQWGVGPVAFFVSFIIYRPVHLCVCDSCAYYVYSERGYSECNSIKAEVSK